MDKEQIEIVGWFLLMIQPTLTLVVIDIFKKGKAGGFFSLLIISVIITFFYNENYSLPVSIIIGFSFFVLILLFSKFFNQRSSILSLAWAIELILIGFFLKKYIFLISFFIWVPIVFLTYLNEKYIDSKDKPGLDCTPINWNIPLLSFFFILEAFGFSNLFGTIDATTIHWFYSTIAQVFAALLGIIVMIGVSQFIIKNPTIIKALKGYTILYIIVILISLFGITFIHENYENEIDLSNQINLGFNILIPSTQSEEINFPGANQIFNSMIFIFSLVLVVGSLLYLYNLVNIMLKS